MTTLEKKLATHAEHMADTIKHFQDGLTTFDEMLEKTDALVQAGLKLLEAEASDNDN